MTTEPRSQGKVAFILLLLVTAAALLLLQFASEQWNYMGFPYVEPAWSRPGRTSSPDGVLIRGTRRQGGRALSKAGNQRSLVVPDESHEKYPYLAQVYDRGTYLDCLGVMVASDVLLTPRWCLIYDGTVVVRGKDESSNSSTGMILHVSDSPSILSPGDVLAVYKTSKVASPGFVPVPFINSSKITEPREGQNVTAIVGGVLEALEAPLQVVATANCAERTPVANALEHATEFCAFAPGSNASPAYDPCGVDHGAPVLDGSGALVGLVDRPGEEGCHDWAVPSRFFRIAYYADWILQATCALTEDTAFQCPDMVCPPNDGVLGYPLAVVPDATSQVKTFNGFKPERVGQSPPAGSLFNTSTTVWVLGVDATERVALCFWTLTFPKIERLAEAYEEIPSGTYEIASFFSSDMMFDGLGVRMTAELGHRLYGNATIELKTGRNESLVLSSSASEDELWFQTPFDPLGEFGGLTVLVTGVQKENYLDVHVYGQATHWYSMYG